MTTPIDTSPGERILDLGAGGQAVFTPDMVMRRADPLRSPATALPIDYAAQYPMPVPTEEVVAMCEEITMLRALPEHGTALKTDQWRELNELYFTSGSSYIAFADYVCPEEYYHDGDDFYVTLKNIGAQKSLGISDIMQSAAIAAGGLGINRIIGGWGQSSQMPGGSNENTLMVETVMNLKEKEIKLGTALVMNGWDRLLVLGDATTRPLEFDGVVQWFANRQCTPHTNDASASGTFSAVAFDRFLAEACAKPTVVMGHPTAIQEMLGAFFQLGFAGSQVINIASGPNGQGGITPGFNFAGFVNTGIGRLAVIADSNFPRTNVGGGNFMSNLYAMRMTHNGEDLVYKVTQIPLALKDLAPGCTTIAFMLWAKTALVIKHCCAHSVFTGYFGGRITTTCPVIGAS